MAGTTPRTRPSWAEVRIAAGDCTVLGLLCLATYLVVTHLLARVHFLSRPDDLPDGMWAVIAAIFVYRNSYHQSIVAAASRMSATVVSLVICLVYLLFFSFSPWGLAPPIGLSVLAVTLLGRSEDAVTAAITTAVVMVVAAVS